MPLNQALACKLRAHNRGIKMLTIAFHFEMGARNLILDITFNLLWGGKHLSSLLNKLNDVIYSLIVVNAKRVLRQS